MPDPAPVTSTTLRLNRPAMEYPSDLDKVTDLAALHVLVCGSDFLPLYGSHVRTQIEY
jgi:hypothetical protein